MGTEPSDDLELIWKLPTTNSIVMSYRSVYKHGEDSFAQMLEKELEQAGPEGRPPEHPDQDRLYIHRKSFLLILYAFLERHLFDLCDLSAGHFKKDLRVRDMSDTGILKCKKYMGKVIGISFGDFNPEWDFIRDLREIRNSYVHKSNKQTLKARLEKIEKHCSVEHSQELPSEYLEKSLNNIDIFFGKLQEKLIEKDNQVGSNQT